MRLWMYVFRQELCVNNVNRVFPNGEGSHLLDGGIQQYQTYDEYDHVEDGTIRSLQYNWDTNAGTFVAMATPTPVSSSVTETVIPEPNPTPIWSVSLSEAYLAADYTYIVERTAGEDYDLSNDNHLAELFFRALALKALGRSDGALLEFVEIYEAEPDSAWGQLAALHFDFIP